jgi:hypothetical protein
VSFVATVAQLALLVALAYLPFAWWERVKADGRSGVDLERFSYCAGMFQAGERTYPSAEPTPCYNKAGKVTVLVTKQYHCDDGTTLFANYFGWWGTEDTILRVSTDRGKPPRAALDRCISR